MEMIKQRLKRLRNLMRKNEIDVFVLLVEERANSESCHYISGFRGSSAALIIDYEHEFLITDGRYKTQSKNQSPFEIIIQSKISLPAFIAEHIRNSDYKSAGFEANKISHATFEKFFAPIKIKWFDASNFIPELRRTKDGTEIKYIKQAALIARNAYGNALKQIKTGMSEIDFDIILNGEIKKLGAEKGWAHDDFIVASGERSAMCHAPATSKIFKTGDTVTIDYGAMFEGYMSDITRNFAIGTPDKKFIEINKILLEAHHTAADALKPGVTGREIDSIAREIISKYGYGENFLHGLGHGLGLEVHETPSQDILQAGDVVTIEPGIYIEGLGGLRIEDDYLITPSGHECLTVTDNQSLEIL